MNIKETADAFAAAFITDTRPDGHRFVKLHDDAPDWMTDVVRDAHGDMLPDDTRYRMVNQIADQLTEYEPDDWDDSDFEICDSLVDIYHYDRFAWLASHLQRQYYCDEAQDDGLIDAAASISDRIAIGQFQEYREIFGAVVEGLRAQADDE